MKKTMKYFKIVYRVLETIHLFFHVIEMFLYHWPRDSPKYFADFFES